MESSGEVLKPTLDFIDCPSDGLQPVSGPYKIWDKEISDAIGERSLITTECPKCRNTKRVLEQIGIPHTSVNFAVPKGWVYQVETPTTGKVAEITASSMGELSDPNHESMGALLKVKVFAEQKPDLKLNWPVFSPRTTVGNQEVVSYKMMNEESQNTDIVTQFTHEGRSYQIRLTYNPEVYPNGETCYTTILRSFQFPTT